MVIMNISRSTRIRHHCRPFSSRIPNCNRKRIEVINISDLLMI